MGRFENDSLHLSDLAGLVVAAKNSQTALVAYFQGHQESDCLDRVIASVNIIAHEEIVCFGRRTTDLEKFTKIVELAVDVAANSHRRFHKSNIRLILKYFFSL